MQGARIASSVGFLLRREPRVAAGLVALAFAVGFVSSSASAAGPLGGLLLGAVLGPIVLGRGAGRLVAFLGLGLACSVASAAGVLVGEGGRGAIAIEPHELAALGAGPTRVKGLRLRPGSETTWSTSESVRSGKRTSTEIHSHGIALAVDERGTPRALVTCDTGATAGCARAFRAFEGWVERLADEESEPSRRRAMGRSPELGRLIAGLPVVRTSESPDAKRERGAGLGLFALVLALGTAALVSRIARSELG